eukprot:1327713-Pyramimonas_sp.AAC.1
MVTERIPGDPPVSSSANLARFSMLARARAESFAFPRMQCHPVGLGTTTHLQRWRRGCRVTRATRPAWTVRYFQRARSRGGFCICLLYTSPSPRDRSLS